MCFVISNFVFEVSNKYERYHPGIKPTNLNENINYGTSVTFRYR